MVRGGRGAIRDRILNALIQPRRHKHPAFVLRATAGQDLTSGDVHLYGPGWETLADIDIVGTGDVHRLYVTAVVDILWTKNLVG